MKGRERKWRENEEAGVGGSPTDGMDVIGFRPEGKRGKAGGVRTTLRRQAESRESRERERES